MSSVLEIMPNRLLFWPGHVDICVFESRSVLWIYPIRQVREIILSLRPNIAVVTLYN